MSDQYGDEQPEQLEVMGVAGANLEDDPSDIDVEALSAEADRLEELHDELRSQLVGHDQPPQQ